MRLNYNRSNTKELQNLRKKIGENLRAQRLKNKITLRYMSDKIGFGSDVIDQYEMGKRHIQLEEINVFAAFFNVSMMSFLR
ncbi:MAG: helix-turn-helix domain-containing protein [Alphaproteobacteria bacterium]